MTIPHTVSNNFIFEAFCTNPECLHFRERFSLENFSRCPLCGEPGDLQDMPLQSLQQEGIGNTKLRTNEHISNWADLSQLYLKDETSNPTGSFKERGSLTAISLHKEQLKARGKKADDLIIGTVSTGNMAISTAWMARQQKLRGFVIVHESIKKAKLDVIQKAIGQADVTLFLVKGNYALFHDQVYKVCQNMRKEGTSVFAELTDDIFRIYGYSTLFTEMVQQLSAQNKKIDFVVIPVASGGLFRVAVWTFESLKKQGFIDYLPQVVLVQEQGADPIVQAFENNQSVSSPIQMKENLVAQAIDVSNSRSGTASLRILRKGYHLCTSVDAVEIIEAQHVLEKEQIYVEEAGAVSLSATKKLRKENIIKQGDTVVVILSGAQVEKRKLYQEKIFTPKIIQCTIEQLDGHLLQTF